MAVLVWDEEKADDTKEVRLCLGGKQEPEQGCACTMLSCEFV
jgi:hypothetical protein